MSVRDWFTFFRWHTAALTIPVVVLGFVAAGGQMLSWTSLIWAVFGFLFHAAGFADNNICDYEEDLKDPNKAHMPLVRGAINVETAKIVVQAMLGALFVYGVFLSFDYYPAFIVFVVAFVFGLAYNRLCKKTLWAPVLISLCFAPLPLFSYVATTSSLAPVAWMMFAAVFMQIMFQIAWSGYYKDIASDKINLLRRLGCGLENYRLVQEGMELYRFPEGAVVPQRFKCTDGAAVFGSLLKVVGYVVGAFLYILLMPAGVITYGFFVYTGLWFLQMFLFAQMLRLGPWENKQVTQLCALIEILAYWSFVVALSPILSFLEMVVLIMAPLLWFIGWNRMFWSRTLGPRV